MLIHHFWTSYEPKEQDSKLRQKLAKSTWTTQLWEEVPVKDKDLPRLWEEEGRRFPYVRDVFDFACNGLPHDDIMVYTNADICVRSDCAIIVAHAMQEADAFYSMRRDFNHDFTEPIPDEFITRGDAYVGSDLYGFRVHWWRKNRFDMPDLIVGLEAWDACLRKLIELTNPGRITSIPNTHYHRRHASPWESAENRYRWRGQLYCLKTASKWMRNHGVNPNTHGIKV